MRGELSTIDFQSCLAVERTDGVTSEQHMNSLDIIISRRSSPNTT